MTSSQSKSANDDQQPGDSLAELQGVTLDLGPEQRLQNVSFRVRQGQTTALAGDYNSGRNLAAKVLLGVKKPAQGRVQLFGRDPRDPAARTRLGALPTAMSSLPAGLTCAELLDFAQAHYARSTSFEQLDHWFGIKRLMPKPAASLTDEQSRRFSLALVFAGRPELLVIPEPTAGLDGHWRKRIWQALTTHRRQQGTALITTFDLAEAVHLADHLVLFDRGRVVASGKTREIMRRGDVKRPPDVDQRLTIEHMVSQFDGVTS